MQRRGEGDRRRAHPDGRPLEGDAIAALRARVERLEAEVARLNASGRDFEEPVLSLLRRYGLRVHSWNSTDALLLPEGASFEAAQRFYRLMRKYSFRLFLRDAIKMRRFRAQELSAYPGQRTAASYADLLVAAGVLVPRPGGAFALAREKVTSFGETLEWYTARVLLNEFGAPALWSVRLSGTPAGGDYDVLAAAEGRLLYVEVKSSPPKHVVAEEVSAFLDRVEAIAPVGAVFLEDTGLRMYDKIVPMFAEALAARGRPAPKRVRGEMFAVGDRVLIANSKPDLARNLGVCLARFLG